MRERVAWATPVFESVKAPAYRSHMELYAQMSFGTELYLLEPTTDRLTYPFCVFDMVQIMLNMEDKVGRFDWFFWLEDDILPPVGLWESLREDASAEHRPFVSALAYCRNRPYWPGASDVIQENGLVTVRQWQEAPVSGTHPVDRVGMCACIIHRDLFDKIPQPWFGVAAPMGTMGIGPDAHWCRQLLANGVQPYICCDAEVKHLTSGMAMDRDKSEAWNASRRASTTRE